jgi:glucose/arabinose dehydrogenase
MIWCLITSPGLKKADFRDGLGITWVIMKILASPASVPISAGQAIVPDVLLQSHSASLEMVFYTATSGVAAFPAEYHGDIFAAFHGSWNRSVRTGYKVVRVRVSHGVATGEYDDFLTGFVIDDDRVWGRPVGVAVAHDGALLVTEDGNGTVWRVSYVGK